MFKDFWERSRAAIQAFTKRAGDSKDEHDAKDEDALCQQLGEREESSPLARTASLVDEPSAGAGGPDASGLSEMLPEDAEAMDGLTVAADDDVTEGAPQNETFVFEDGSSPASLPPGPRLDQPDAKLPSLLAPGEDQQGQESLPPLQPSLASSTDVDRLMAQMEDDEAVPRTADVFVPPEMQGREMPPPPLGVNVVSPGEVPSPVLDADATGQINAVEPGVTEDPPMTERQGDEIIRVLEEQRQLLDDISKAIEGMTTALQELAAVIPSLGGVV